jgi:hypothetical protein
VPLAELATMHARAGTGGLAGKVLVIAPSA